MKIQTYVDWFLKMLNNFFYFIFFLIKIFIPTKKNLLVFGDRTGRRFGDNSRYLFIYINKYHKNKKCVWLTKDKKILKKIRSLGYKCFLFYSFRGILLSIIAEWHIYDFSEKDINSLFTKLSNNINLWHGILFKKLKKYKENSITDSFFKLSNFFFKKYIIYPNKIYSDHLLKHYPGYKYKLLVSNSPRNILLSKKNKSNIDIYALKNEKKICDYLIQSKKKIIGYFPTWRFNGLEIFPNNFNYENILKLNNFLQKNNCLIVIKKHPNSFKEDKHILYNRKIENIYKKLSKLKGFYLLNYEVDLNSIIHNCDILISDYSGAIFDYLLINKPIIFYVPDLNIYSRQPGLHFNLKNIKIGPIALNLDDLLNKLKEHLKHPEKTNKKFKKFREKFREKIFKEEDCFKQIIKILN